MRNINMYDTVLISMTRNDIFPFMEACTFVAEVQSLPVDTGDMLYLKTNEGIEVCLNPTSSDFIGMVKIKSYND